MYRLDEHGNPIIPAAMEQAAPPAAAATPTTPCAKQEGTCKGNTTFAAASTEDADNSNAQQASPAQARKPRKAQDKLRALYEKLPFDTRP